MEKFPLDSLKTFEKSFESAEGLRMLPEVKYDHPTFVSVRCLPSQPTGLLNWRYAPIFPARFAAATPRWTEGMKWTCHPNVRMKLCFT